MSEETRADAALAVLFGRPCACPEHHAVSGACHQKAEVATAAGGMCRPCARCDDAAALTWAPVLHEVFDLSHAPVDWPQVGLTHPRGAQACR